jgi:hypothetical protein
MVKERKSRMQLKLELPGIELEPVQDQLWSKLELNAQRSVIETLAKITIKALSQKEAELRTTKEGASNGKQ